MSTRRVYTIEQLTKAFLTQFGQASKNPSPFVTVIVQTGYVEHALKSVLEHFLLPKSDPVFTGTDSALGSFSRCRDVAYYLGLIPLALCNNIQRLGKIRNEFAHNPILDFEDEKVKKVALSLTVKETHMAEGKFRKQVEEDLQNAKYRFTFACNSAFEDLRHTVARIRKEKLRCAPHHLDRDLKE
jgi:hypothetical protein